MKSPLEPFSLSAKLPRPSSQLKTPFARRRPKRDPAVDQQQLEENVQLDLDEKMLQVERVIGARKEAASVTFGLKSAYSKQTQSIGKITFAPDPVSEKVQIYDHKTVFSGTTQEFNREELRDPENSRRPFGAEAQSAGRKVLRKPTSYRPQAQTPRKPDIKKTRMAILKKKRASRSTEIPSLFSKRSSGVQGEPELHPDETRSSPQTQLLTRVNMLRMAPQDFSRFPNLREYMAGNGCPDPAYLETKDVKVINKPVNLRLLLGRVCSELVGAEGDVLRPRKTLARVGAAPPDKRAACCLASVWGYLKTKYERIFFKKLWRFFGENYLKEVKKLNPINKDDLPTNVIANFRAIKSRWEAAPKRRGRKLSLLWNLILNDNGELYWAVLCRVGRQATDVLIPFVMKQFLDQMKKGKHVEWGYSVQVCCLVGLLTLVKELFGQQASRFTSNTRKRMRLSLYCLVYEKLVVSNSEFLSKVGPGFMSKLVLFDLDPIIEFVCAIPNLAAVPVIVTFAFIMVGLQMKFSVYLTLVFGLFVLILLLIVHLLQFSIRFRKQYRAATTRAYGYLSEFVKHIKLVKANSLQGLIDGHIKCIRDRQSSYLKRIHLIDTIVSILYYSPTLLMSLVVIAIQRAANENLDVLKLYAVVTTLSQLRKPIMAVTEFVDRYSDFKKSYSNVTGFLDGVPDYPKLLIRQIPVKGCPEGEERFVTFQFPQKADTSKAPTDIEDNFSVQFRQCTFVDRSQQMEFKVSSIFRETASELKEAAAEVQPSNQTILQKSNLFIKKQAKVCLMGSESSGVEHFLLALKKELELAEGEMLISGKVCLFDSKTAKLIDQLSFRDNIVLDSDYDKERFEQICSTLKISFKKFLGKEYGIVRQNQQLVSHNDRIMILLARALYQEFDIFCFLHFFSQLHFQDRLPVFEALIDRYLVLTTVFYFSNDIELARKSDLILVFSEGRIVEQGSFAHLMLDRSSAVFKRAQKQESLLKVNLLTEHTFADSLSLRKFNRRKSITGLDRNLRDGLKYAVVDFKKAKLLRFFVGLIFLKRHLRIVFLSREAFKANSREGEVLTASLFGSLHKLLGKACCGAFPALVLCFSVSAASFVLWDVWLGWWSTDYLKLSSKADYFNHLVSISAAIASLIFLRQLFLGLCVIRASGKVLLGTLGRIVSAESRYFAYFKPAKISYRMSTDQAVVDSELTRQLSALLFNLLSALLGFLVLNVVYPGFFFLITVLLLNYLRNCISRWFRTMKIFMAELFRRKLVWYNAYVLTLEHLMALRHISKHRYFEKYFVFVTEEFIRINSHAGSAGNRWVGIRLSVGLAVIATVTYLCPVIMQYYSVWDFKENIWLLGFGLSWSQKTMSYISDAVTGLSGVFSVVESCERVLELQMKQDAIDKLIREFSPDAPPKQEEVMTEIRPAEVKTEKSSSVKTTVEIHGVNVMMKDTLTLKNFSLRLSQGETVALVGIDSSAVEVLFDLLGGFCSFSPKRGSYIKIADKDITSMSHPELRSHFLTLKKNPIVLSGTLRDNIDPFSKFSDDQIIAVLHQLKFIKYYEQHIKSNSSQPVKNIDQPACKLNAKLPKFALSKHTPNLPIKNRSISNCWKRKKPNAKNANSSKQQQTPFHSLTQSGKGQMFAQQITFTRASPGSRFKAFMHAWVRFAWLLKKVRRSRSGGLRRVRYSRFTDLINNQCSQIPMNCGALLCKRQKCYSKDDLQLQVRFDANKLPASGITKEVLSKQFLRENRRNTAVSGLQRLDRQSEVAQGHSTVHTITLKRLLSSWISFETCTWSTPMKKVISLARAFLEKPCILLVEEEALVVEDSCPEPYLDSIFQHLKGTTILCEMDSFQLLDWMDRTVIIRGNELIEQSSTKSMLLKGTSELNKKLERTDQMKLEGRAYRRNSHRLFD